MKALTLAAVAAIGLAGQSEQAKAASWLSRWTDGPSTVLYDEAENGDISSNNFSLRFNFTEPQHWSATPGTSWLLRGSAVMGDVDLLGLTFDFPYGGRFLTTAASSVGWSRWYVVPADSIATYFYRWGADEAFTGDWSIRVTHIPAVPIPAAAPILLTGGALLGLIRRRRPTGKDHVNS